MSNVPRLLRILNTVARYRLYTFLRGQKGGVWVKLLLLPFILINLGGNRKLNRGARLRRALEDLGPIYIKFGQLLSTRRDFLPADVADELQSLQDQVPPFAKPSIEELVQQSLGVPVESVFSSLDSKPLASASVAQVHPATLISGEEVVVKVLRPGIETIVVADLALLKRVARFIQNLNDFGKRLRPLEVVSDYEKVILNELDLRAEAANTSQLKQNFENSSMLYVPRIYWDYTRSNVLVMERIHGVPVTDIDRIRSSGVDLRQLAENGVNIFFTQVFEHNFFHADMHPGNIFVNTDIPENAQYIAIDCAIIGSLSKDDQEYLARNLLAIFKRNYRQVAELHVECGWVPRETPIHEFESAMRTVCEPIFEKPLKEISFGHLLVQLFRTAGRFDMEVQPSLVLLQKTLLNIEGLGRQLYPDLDLWNTALPYLENWNTRRLNPFTLLGKIKDNIPNWIDQLPDLPQHIINAVVQVEQLEQVNVSLQQQIEEREQSLKAKRLRARTGGVFFLATGTLTLLTPLGSILSGIPTVSVGLLALGVYLLCFKE